MPGILDYVQYTLGRLLYSVRGHDAKQLTHGPAFKDIPEPNMTVEAPDCGASGSPLRDHHTCLSEDGNGNFPELHWTVPSGVEIKEQVLLCEDPDPPIPGFVINHGIFYGIPPEVNEARHEDVQIANGNGNPKHNEYLTKSGWKYIPTMKGTSWIGAAAPLGHGVHRYMFTVVALKEKLELYGTEVNKQKLKDAMVGKVVGWGQWIGVFERPWPK